MTSSKIIRVCFVCLGNICRSPLAHGLFEQLIAQKGLDQSIEAHSAGTGSWHVGESPDQRMRATAQRKGVQLNSRARQFIAADFDRFHLVLAMDQYNQEVLQRMCSREVAANKLRLFRSFDPQGDADLDVPDPYYGGNAGFENVFNIVQRTCPEVLNYLKDQHSITQ